MATGTLLLIVMIIVAVSIYRNGNKKESEQEAGKTSQTTPLVQNEEDSDSSVLSQETVAQEDVEETDDERLARVKKEATKNGYPEDVIELLDKNPETVDFVEDYGTKKDQEPADTIGDDFVAGEIPKLIQWDERWGYSTYGNSVIAASGCGPTCLSMVIIGLTQDPTVTPDKVADYSMATGQIDDDDNTYWTLMSDAAANWGLYAEEGLFTEDEVSAYLNNGQPIICSMGEGDFTREGHFIVLTGYEDGKVTLNDPFNTENSNKTWVYADIEDQIKEMWSYTFTDLQDEEM
jgi:hypothetical protein